MARIHFSKCIILAIFRVTICSYWSYMALLVPPIEDLVLLAHFQWLMGPLKQKLGEKLGKNLKNPFFSQFPWLDMAIFMPKICLNWPNVVPLVPPERYFDGQVCFYKFLGPLNGENEKKVTKSIFHFAFQATTVSSRCKIFDLNAHFGCSLGPCWGIGICKVVS